ncbi:MAG: ABC transporter permease [Desulfobacterales bacterium]|nr:ABC transporter permease [Desulfobacterales bacterium]
MNHITQKMVKILLVILFVTGTTFFMVDLLPGDAAYEVAGETAGMADINAIREDLGLNRPLLIRYGIWLKNVCQGDLGVSHRTGEVVWDSLMERLPVTIELMVIAQVLALLLALPLGIACAYRAHSRFDTFLGSAAFVFMSTPVFITALVFIYVFAVKLNWLPATGYVPLSQAPLANLKSFILPGLSIALAEWVPLMRVLRSDMISVLKEDYILLARAKGIPDHKILFHHALKPSSFTLITLLGIQVGHLISGTVVVETIFALPGLGRLLVNAIYGRDTFMIQGCILFITFAYILINLTVDTLYAILDPKIRTRRM